MNEITISTGGLPETMTSVEMANLVEKRHDNVKRTIDSLAKSGVIQLPQIEEVTNHLGQRVEIYKVGERDSYVIVAQLSPEFTAALVDYWQKHKGQQVDMQAALGDPAWLRGALVVYTEKVIALERRVEEMLPTVEAYEQIADTHGTMNRTEAAKHLGVPPHVLCKWMRTNGWTYRRAGSKDDIAYQSKINAGYLEHKVTTGPRPDGTEWIGTQVRVTPKGLTVLAKAFPKHAVAA